MDVVLYYINIKNITKMIFLLAYLYSLIYNKRWNYWKTEGMVRKMKNRKITALAVTAAVAVLVLGGIFAVRTVSASKTVFAAEERTAITSENAGTTLHALAGVEVMKTYKSSVYGETGCTVVLPTGYVASDSVKGMYLAERHPLDSSNIYYTVSESVDSQALESALNSDEYKNQAEKQFKEVYGTSAAISAYKMTKTEIDGCPAYQIELSCRVEDMEMEQLIYIIAADKVYTITYSQASDDERMEDFKKSAETIRMIWKQEEKEKEK